MLQNTRKEDSAMSKTNFKKFLAVALLGTMGLVGCSSEIQAKPTGYDGNLLTFSENDEIYHNLVSLVEDAYRDGSLASNVLDQVLYQYAVSVFGRYNKVAKPYNLGEGEITLKQAAADIEAHSTYDAEGVRTTSGATVAEEFINKFKAYQSLDKDGKRQTEASDKQSEFDRVMAKWQTIGDRIAISMYNDIIGGSYSERGRFSEKKYLMSLYNAMDKVSNPYNIDAADLHEDVVFTPDVEDKDVFKAAGYLNRDNYQDAASYTLAGDEDKDTAKNRYVEDELIPVVYRTLLVEQYLLDESYNTLGRSYARKVNVLAVAKNDYNTYLVQDFVRNEISKGEEINLAAFNNVSAINVGLRDKIETIAGDAFGSTATQAFMAEFGYEYVPESAADAEDDYYLGTDYGDMMQEYRKITDNILTTDTSAESSFTGSYTYSKEIGKEIKENELANKDYTQNGWYIKNGGLSDLPDEIRTRLFNIGVANALDNDDVQDRYNAGAYAVPENESNYVAKINGKYYLKVGSKETGAAPEDDILFNLNGTSYVIQIEEAISASKLSKESEIYDSTAKEEIINEVAKVIAADDSYKTLSTKHWLEKCALKYHDTVVYDYFKSNYPELFEDD